MGAAGTFTFRIEPCGKGDARILSANEAANCAAPSNWNSVHVASETAKEEMSWFAPSSPCHGSGIADVLAQVGSPVDARYHQVWAPWEQMMERQDHTIGGRSGHRVPALTNCFTANRIVQG